jgi:hypothetical protein
MKLEMLAYKISIGRNRSGSSSSDTRRVEE